LESQITAAFASGNLNEIHALLERENIEVISLSSRKFPNSSDLKKKSLLGHEISFDIAKQLADSYKMDAFVPISEIICLKDGDVVSFRKLGISPDGMDIKHFRIVKIEEVRLTNSDYEIRCIANCIYLV